MKSQCDSQNPVDTSPKGHKRCTDGPGETQTNRNGFQGPCFHGRNGGWGGRGLCASGTGETGSGVPSMARQGGAGTCWPWHRVLGGKVPCGLQRWPPRSLLTAAAAVRGQGPTGLLEPAPRAFLEQALPPPPPPPPAAYGAVGRAGRLLESQGRGFACPF